MRHEKPKALPVSANLSARNGNAATIDPQLSRRTVTTRPKSFIV
jgi:hypothetical protein